MEILLTVKEKKKKQLCNKNVATDNGINRVLSLSTMGWGPDPSHLIGGCSKEIRGYGV